MSDFERMLTEELSEASEGRPASGNLLTGARRRIRRRRAGILVATTAAILVGVGTMIVLDGGSDRGVEPADRSPAVIEGWTTVSYHDLTFQVPPSFTFGNPSQWCGRGDMPAPDGYIELPGSVSTLMACARPEYWYGATLVPQGGQTVTDPSAYPEGASIAVPTAGEARLVVVTASARTTSLIADSFHTFTGADANGCPADRGGILDKPSGASAVCMFGADNRLRQSSHLNDEAAARMRTGIRRAMADDQGDDGGSRGCASPSYTSIVVLLDDSRFDVVLDSPCGPQNGLFYEGRHYALTKFLTRSVVHAGYSGILGRGVPLVP